MFCIQKNVDKSWPRALLLVHFDSQRKSGCAAGAAWGHCRGRPAAYFSFFTIILILNSSQLRMLAAGAASPLGLKGLVDNFPPAHGYPQGA